MEEMRKSRKDDEEKKNGLSLPPSVKAYLDPDYWNRRFTSEDHYEWLKDYSHFQHIMMRHVKATDSVLELGCGSSQLCENLYKDGITNITCIDLSAVAVEKMQKRLKEKQYSGIQVLEADMLDLPFGPETFDVVIEKGTLDVLFVDSGDPWNPSPSTVDKVIAMLKCVHRVLRQDGTYISISFGQPHFRRSLFEMEEFTWSIEWETFGDGFHYFFYTLKKGKRSSSVKHSHGRSDATPIHLLHEELDSEDYLFRTDL
ncbi:unnamed protein product [Victoria cruziana]